MKKISQFVVDHTKPVIVLFFAVALLGILLKGLVGVNYEMSDYLPEGSPSTVALDVMQEEFGGGIPNARVMVKDVTVPEALEYKEKLSEIDGVTDVTWLDDAVDVTIPLEMLDQDTVETYYKDGAALFSVTAEKEKQLAITQEIRKIIGDDNAATGNIIAGADATIGTEVEIKKIAVIAVIFILFVLFLTTNSWLEPAIILLGLGIAVLINAGSNLIFGEISFVTNAAGSILQLAVSLDYSVFLMHRFEESYQQIKEPKEAMVDALCKSVNSILSSGLTTVIGFLALIFMRFRLGSDLGLALAKGIGISLITVFLFMPALILISHKLLVKTRHRRFLPDFHRFGKSVSRVMIPFVILFIIVILPGYLASNHNEFYYGSAYIYGEDTRYGQDTKAIDDVFGERETYVVMVPQGDLATEQELSDSLHTIPQVKNILSYVDSVGAEIPMEYLDEDIRGKLISEHYSRFVLTLDTAPEGEETFALIEKVRRTIQEYYPDTCYMAGEGVSSYDLMDTITADMVKVNLIAIGAVFVVLLITLRKIRLPIILVLCIETAIWINLAIPYFNDTPIFYISYLIISSIQLGATVDYAILLTDRYQEFRQTCDRKKAVIETISAVLASIMTSASVLTVCGFLLGGISTHGILSQLGIFLGRGALLSCIIVLFVLPGFLYLTSGKDKKKWREKTENNKTGTDIGQEVAANEK